MKKYIITGKALILIALMFVFNLFLDMLNEKNWLFFVIGITGWY